MCCEDIINTAIGAFLGFISAYILEIIIEKKRKHNSIKNIVLELKDLKNLLDKTKDRYDVINEIHIPIWEVIVGTGDLLSYIDKPYYEQLIMVYSHIINLKELEKQLIFDNKVTQEQMKKIVERRNAIYNQIVALNIDSLK